MNLTPKDNFEEFNRFLFEEVDLGLYQHKFLQDFINKVQQNKIIFYESSVINTNKNGWILIFHSEMLHVYGYKWRVEQFQEISEIFDLSKYTNYTLSGEDELIDELIKFYRPINSMIEKRRLLYRTEKITSFEKVNFRIEHGTLSQLNELSLMLQEYYHEEYNGLNDKDIEDMQYRMFSLIQTDKVFVLLNSNNKILSFCSINDPDIGILFTKKECRNMGYGKIVLSHCSDLLKRRNGIVYLMTDRDKPESNRVCRKVGFEPYYNYKRIKINCG